MVFLASLAVMAAAYSTAMVIAWIIQQRSGNSGWVDTIWTCALGLIGAAGALAPLDGGVGARQWLVAVMVVAWALRLASHVALRTTTIKDDPRYAEYARQWGQDAPRKMFWFLQSQAFGSLPLVFAVFVAAHAPGPLGLRDILGAAILIGAVVGEGVADAQLKRFRSDSHNRGRVCDTGLWRLSRHPNYFFEWLGWLAYPVIAIAPQAPGAYPFGLAALLAPVLMYYILVHVTGIPPLEDQMQRSRGEAWRDYVRRTSKFFPLPPRA